MTNLASFDLRTALKDSTKLIECVKLLFVHIDKSSSLPYRQPLRHIANYMMGELEKATSAASQSQTLKLAAATRNLFELTFEVEYVCASDANMPMKLAQREPGATSSTIRSTVAASTALRENGIGWYLPAAQSSSRSS